MEAAEQRRAMVDLQIAARGVADPAVLAAMREVPRELFVPDEVADFAYDDSPLPIAERQTISQPFVVALMLEALKLEGGETVLEIGAGSGYAAAVLSRIAGRVYGVERHEALARQARVNLRRAGIDTVTIVHGDGTRGHPEAAPFDAIVVAAGGPQVPASLRDQLAMGGRLVIPVGPAQRVQRLMRITRTGRDDFEEEDLGGVSFVPLIGAEGWEDRRPEAAPKVRAKAKAPEADIPDVRLPAAVAEAAEPFGAIDEADLDGLLERIGDARVVLLGEATHGTSEFYRMRDRITRALIERKGFAVVAVEADWPDAARVDAWVRHRPVAAQDWSPFERFPRWMWRNAETLDLVDWLRQANRDRAPEDRVSFHGLDMYSLHISIGAVLDYLDAVDPEAAAVARERYGCLTAWQHAPEVYGRAGRTRGFDGCREAVVAALRDLHARRTERAERDGELLFDARRNASLIASAEEYYRIMYEGGASSWNLRDSHMFETLEAVLDHRGPGARAVVWAHNSHVGDAAATEMAARGEHNIGRLARQRFGDGAYLVGFGTHGGTVAAASHWDGPASDRVIRPSQDDSYERLCHDAGIDRFFLPLRHARPALRRALSRTRLERMIGVIYRPESELASHYMGAVLPSQFDEWVWFDTTSPVTPLDRADRRPSATHPLAA